MSEYIPDLIERMDMRNEQCMDNYIDENICMSCKKKVNYELYCISPTGDGPIVCAECAGIE
jgi:hypothetical protein